MKIRFVSAVASLVAAMATVPQSVAADCRLPMFNLYRGYGNAGSFKIAAGANFGLGDTNDQTILGVDGSYAFSDKVALRAGLGRCSSGGFGELTYGAQFLFDFWASTDGKTKLQGGFGANQVSFGDSKTTVVPVQLNVRYAVAPTVDVWGGPEVAVNRFSFIGFPTTDTNLGINAGATVDLAETVSIRAGLSAQFWEGSTTWGVSTSLSFTVPRSN